MITIICGKQGCGKTLMINKMSKDANTEVYPALLIFKQGVFWLEAYVPLDKKPLFVDDLVCEQLTLEQVLKINQYSSWGVNFVFATQDYSVLEKFIHIDRVYKMEGVSIEEPKS